MTKSFQELRNLVLLEYDGRVEETIVIGISGGPDSVLLVRLLASLEKELGIKLHLVHVDHGLRGKESLRDAAFVRHLATELKLPISLKRIPIIEKKHSEGGSWQQVCRHHRFLFFREVMEKVGAETLALGHNMNDRAETILINLLRGSGLKGLSGMLPYEEREDYKIWRPLLTTTREEIEAVLTELDQNYRIDESNLIDDYMRNHLRINLIPFLEKEYNPQIISTLVRMGDVLETDNRYLEKTVKKYFELYFAVDRDTICVNIRDIEVLDPALRLRLFREAYARLRGNLEHLSAQHTQMMDSALRAEHNFSVDLPGQMRLRRCYECLVLERQLEMPGPPLSSTEVIIGEELTFGPYRLLFTINQECPPTELAGSWVFDSDKLFFPLIIRSRQTGDSFVPYGMQGRKSVKNLMIDAKVPQRLRAAMPVLVDAEGDILAVLPLRRGDKAPIVEETQTFLQVQIWEEETDEC